MKQRRAGWWLMRFKFFVPTIAAALLGFGALDMGSFSFVNEAAAQGVAPRRLTPAQIRARDQALLAQLRAIIARNANDPAALRSEFAAALAANPILVGIVTANPIALLSGVSPAALGAIGNGLADTSNYFASLPNNAGEARSSQIQGFMNNMGAAGPQSPFAALSTSYNATVQNSSFQTVSVGGAPGGQNAPNGNTGNTGNNSPPPPPYQSLTGNSSGGGSSGSNSAN